jgi:lauroyl/myristoyl acyltransferase
MGKLSVMRTMKQLAGIKNCIGKECTSYKFSYMNHYYSLRAIFNYGWLLYSNEERIRKITSDIRLKGLHNLDSAINSNRTLIVFSAHIGCFFNILFSQRIVDIMGKRDITLLVPSTAETRRARIQDQLKSFGRPCQLVDISEKTSAIKILRAMKKQSIIGCNLDYAYPYTRNKKIEFMGRIVDMPVGLIELGRRCEVIYLPAYSYIDNDELTIEFEEPFDSTITDNEDNDIEHITKKINNVLEKKIQQIPEQWSFWARLLNAPPVDRKLNDSGVDAIKENI